MEYSIRTILPACIMLSLGFANQANASVINNIGGINYEWLEFSNTVNLSRVSVESMLTDSSSALYGYRYATRAETQSLVESYMPYVPAELNHWEAYLAPGAQTFFNDFGITFSENFGVTYQALSNDGVTFDYNMYLTSYFLHGSAGECGVDFSCVGRMLTAALDGDIQAQFTPARRGFDATWPAPDQLSVYDSSQIAASLLVREILPVPVPAAAWLFGNGLFALFGIAGILSKKVHPKVSNR
jgi:hypothetical protein